MCVRRGAVPGGTCSVSHSLPGLTSGANEWRRCATLSQSRVKTCLKAVSKRASVLPHGFVGIVARVGIEHGLVEALIDADRGCEALGLHVAVEVAGEAPRRHHALD